MKKGRVTIKEIAERAGVSKGTVDRVLHNRGEVSDANRTRIEEIMKDLDFHPNAYAAALARRKPFRFLLIVPCFRDGDYWSRIVKGVEQYAKELAEFNIEILVEHFDQFDVSSLAVAFERAKAMEFDAVIFTPHFHGISREFSSYLSSKGIPFVFVDSNVPEATPIAYFGMDSYKSGALLARLLSYSLRSGQELLLFDFAVKGVDIVNQVSLRYKGFEDYFKEHNLDIKIHTIVLDVAAGEEQTTRVIKFIDENPNIVKCGVLNSKMYLLSKFVEGSKRCDVALFGFDLIVPNVDLVKSGVAEVIISQRPFTQGYLGIKAIVDSVIFKRTTILSNMTPMDIIIKENIDSYVQFNPCE